MLGALDAQRSSAAGGSKASSSSSLSALDAPAGASAPAAAAVTGMAGAATSSPRPGDSSSPRTAYEPAKIGAVAAPQPSKLAPAPAAKANTLVRRAAPTSPG